MTKSATIRKETTNKSNYNVTLIKIIMKIMKEIIIMVIVRNIMIKK